MAIQSKRDESGNILVKVIGDPNLVFVKKAIKIADDYRMQVYFFMNPTTRSCYWVMDRIQICMVADSPKVKEGIVVRTGGRGEGRSSQVKCRYDQPVILAIHDWNEQCTAPQLFSADLGYLSGSNIHTSSGINTSYNLCLGAVQDIASIDMVDALLFGKANNDLSWRGGPITGASSWAKDSTGKRIKIFNMATWPEIEKCKTTIPKEIQECANALRKS